MENQFAVPGDGNRYLGHLISENRVGNIMKYPLSILDLLVATLIVAVHLFHFPLAVRYHESHFMYLVLLTPTLIAIWIHIRTRPSTHQAIFVHYIVCVSWAFMYGFGYALAENNITEARFREEPMVMAVRVAKDMALFALLTSLVYGLVAYLVRFATYMAKSIQRLYQPAE